MKVRLRLFAALREQVGLDELELDLAPGATVDDLLTRVCGIHPVLRGRSFAIAVNHSYTGRDRSLAAGDEVALIPPVSGG